MNGLRSMGASLLIRGGEIVDGTGSPRFPADVVVREGRIAEIRAPSQGSADRVIDARGMLVCPGFIDSHSHDDRLMLEPVSPHPKLSQGVCTVVTGNCGISLAPWAMDAPPAPLDLLSGHATRFERFADYLQALDDEPPCMNVVPLLGHTSLRVKHVTDLSRPASAGEARAMRQEVVDALEAGAFGLSTGVYYPPARAASTQELLEVCAPLKAHRAILAMHIRDEADRVVEALREALEVGAQSQARLVISHHKVMGAANHGRTILTLEMIDAAARDQSVCLDCYPYEASSTMLDAEKAARAGHVLITGSRPHPDLVGRSLASIAQDWSVTPREAAERLMPGGAIYFLMSPEDVDRVLMHPSTMIGSDGLPHDPRPHPRLWGAFARVLGHYSRDRGLFPMETAIHKMSGLPATRYGLPDRGFIKHGQAADLVILDPARVAERASYDNPTAPAEGIDTVIVNGVVALQRGEILNLHAGRRLRPLA